MKSINYPLRPLSNIDLIRYNKKIVKTEGCWWWTGSTDDKGYAKFGITYKKVQLLYRTQRIAYYLAYGIDPDNLFVCHHCDNGLCVNPEHLFLGTAQDNMDDMLAKRIMKEIQL